MKILAASISDVVLIEPEPFSDSRGIFMETFHQTKFGDLALPTAFVQDSYSRSRFGTIRGLHYQRPFQQGKLVWVVRGEVFDVAVDLRRNSRTFGQWTANYLSDANHRQVYVPPGFAHGFCVTSDVADLIYKSTEIYHGECEHAIAWNDPQLAIDWPVRQPILSDRDKNGMRLGQAPCYE